MFRTFLEDIANGRGATGAGLSGDIQIETGFLHLQPEFDGTQCPVLTDGIVQIGQLLGGGKVKQGRVTGPAELFDGYTVSVMRHWRLLRLG